jgi:hypothetical protein
VGRIGIEPSASWRTFPVKVFRSDNFGKSYFGINVFINSFPFADFSCFSLRIAALLSGCSSEYMTIQGLNLEVYPLFIELL